MTHAVSKSKREIKIILQQQPSTIKVKDKYLFRKCLAGTMSQIAPQSKFVIPLLSKLLGNQVQKLSERL